MARTAQLQVTLTKQGPSHLQLVQLVNESDPWIEKSVAVRFAQPSRKDSQTQNRV
jgi:hypothetical protein